MPKRRWKVRQTVGQQHAAIRAANRTYRSDMAEAQESQKGADSTIKSMETLMGVGKALKKLGPAKEAMDKLKEQQKFKRRKNQL